MSGRVLPAELLNMLLTPIEVAKVLKCSKSTAAALIGDGSIPSAKIGGLRRVRASDLTDYIAEAVERSRRAA